MCILCGGNSPFNKSPFDIEHMEETLKKLNDAERKTKMILVKEQIRKIENLPSSDDEDELLFRSQRMKWYTSVRNSFAKYL